MCWQIEFSYSSMLNIFIEHAFSTLKTIFSEIKKIRYRFCARTLDIIMTLFMTITISLGISLLLLKLLVSSPLILILQAVVLTWRDVADFILYIILKIWETWDFILSIAFSGLKRVELETRGNYLSFKGIIFHLQPRRICRYMQDYLYTKIYVTF